MRQSERVKLLAGHVELDRWLPALHLEQPALLPGRLKDHQIPKNRTGGQVSSSPIVRVELLLCLICSSA
jgi:hypothetical protein